MNQIDLKKYVCNEAYLIIEALNQIKDSNFVDDIISAISSNDTFMLLDMNTRLE